MLILLFQDAGDEDDEETTLPLQAAHILYFVCSAAARAMWLQKHSGGGTQSRSHSHSRTASKHPCQRGEEERQRGLHGNVNP